MYMKKIGNWGNRLEINIIINISYTKIYYINITHKSYLLNLTKKENE